MLDLNKLAKVSNEVACEKGWWNGAPRSVAQLTLLMQSENIEALEDYRDNKGLKDVWYEVKFKTGNTARLNASELAAESAERGDAIKEAKPCGIPIELADTLIRIADYAEHRGLNLNSEYEKLPSGRTCPSFDEALAESNYWLSKVWYGHKMRDEAGIAHQLVKAADVILLMCEHEGIDIEKAIEEKTAFNRNREFRHGGKKI